MEVKNYWVRIFILITYFIVVFIVSRILDLVLWYHHGYLPNDLVDPIVLNVRQLKLLLDSRGISYTGVLEKQQLVELLNDSGEFFLPFKTWYNFLFVSSGHNIIYSEPSKKP